MTVVSDSSPLITLARIGQLALLPKLYCRIVITPQVYREVVIDGAGLAGSAEIPASTWIDVQAIVGREGMAAIQGTSSLGAGELSVILLAEELNANLVLIDEVKARRAAQQRGLAVLGCVGILEDAFGMRLLPDLRQAYRQMLKSGAYIDPRILENSLKALSLPPL